MGQKQLFPLLTDVYKMHSPFWSISLAIYKYFLLLVFAFILCPNLSPCLFCVCSAFWFSCHALRQTPAHLQMFQDRAQTLAMTFRWCNSARSDFMMDISSPTSNTPSTGASGCRVIEHNSLEQMINTYQKCTLQLKRNPSCYLAAAVIHFLEVLLVTSADSLARERWQD